MDLKGMPRNRLIFIGVSLVVILAIALAIIFGRSHKTVTNPVTLTAWGTEPKASVDALIAEYVKLRPNVTVKYSELDPTTYNNALLDSFITGKAPDIFMIGNHEVTSRLNVLAAATSTQFNIAQLDSLYPSVIKGDLVVGRSLYALPLRMDNLVLVYNRALLDKAGIATPPTTWEELISVIPQLRTTNSQGQLLQAAVAIGGTEVTVPHAADILSLLMLQNGAEMTSVDGRANFADTRSPAYAAFQFYLTFANPSSNAYTWNESNGNGLDSFLAGKTAMIFAYQSDLASIRSRSPFLNIGVAPMLQPAAGTIANYSSYPAFAVWKRSHSPAWAWDFVIFAGTNATGNQAYLGAKNAPVLRTLIPGVRDPETAILAKQGLTAKTWQVPNYDKMRLIFSTAIGNVLAGRATYQEALQAAQDQINNLPR